MLPAESFSGEAADKQQARKPGVGLFHFGSARRFAWTTTEENRMSVIQVPRDDDFIEANITCELCALVVNVRCRKGSKCCIPHHHCPECNEERTPEDMAELARLGLMSTCDWPVGGPKVDSEPE